LAGVATLSFLAYRVRRTRKVAAAAAVLHLSRQNPEADRHGGLRAQLLDRDRLDLTISAASRRLQRRYRGQARHAGPGRNLEIGRNSMFTVWRPRTGAILKILMPLRAAFTVERSLQHIGWVFHPKLECRHHGSVRDARLEPGLGRTGVRDRSRTTTYSVSSLRECAASRLHEASGGYAGMRYLASMTKRFPRFWVGARAIRQPERRHLRPQPCCCATEQLRGRNCSFCDFAESSARVLSMNESTADAELRCVVVPVSNHEGALPRLVDSLRTTGLPCWLVDDGSDPPCADSIVELAADNARWLLAFGGPQSGRARRSWAVCGRQRAAFTHAIQIDADLQHDPRQIPRFVAAACEHPEAIITACRSMTPRSGRAPARPAHHHGSGVGAYAVVPDC
jgi:hypothetical protein